MYLSKRVIFLKTFLYSPLQFTLQFLKLNLTWKIKYFSEVESEQTRTSFKDTNGTSDFDNTTNHANRPIMDKYSVRQFCTQESSNLFRCNLCRKTYTHISNFCRHFLSSHHGIRQEVPCPVCTRMFTRRDNMLTHMKQVHRVSAPKVYATNNNSSSRFEYNSLWYFIIVHVFWHTTI